MTRSILLLVVVCACSPGETGGGDDGDASPTPGDSASSQGDSATTPGDSGADPGDTNSIPGDNLSNPGDDDSPPGDDDSPPGDTDQPSAVWYPLGTSDLGPHADFLTWDSDSGGGVSNSAGSSGNAAFAVAPNGDVWLAWQERAYESGTYALRVRRYDGSGWQGVSDAVSTVEELYFMGIVVDGSNRPIVAYSQAPTSGDPLNVYVKALEAGTWQGLGVSATGGGISDSALPSWTGKITLTADGHPAVAWTQMLISGTYQVYLRAFDGVAWLEVGTDSASSFGVSDSPANGFSPALTLDGSDRLVLAWVDDRTGTTEIYVKRFETDNWVEWDGSASGTGISATTETVREPSIARGAGGEVIVAWWHGDTSGSGDIYVKQSDGLTWSELGTGSATGGGVSQQGVTSGSPALAVDASGRAVLTWWAQGSSWTYQAYLRRWETDAWVELDGSGSGAGVSDSFNPYVSSSTVVPVVVEPVSQQPIVGWSDPSSRAFELYLRHFDGAAWQGMGSANAAGSGLSDPLLSSGTPTVRFDDNDDPTVVWVASVSDAHYIFAKRWSVDSWSALDGSTAPPGIATQERHPGPVSVSLNAAGEPALAWYAWVVDRYCIHAIAHGASGWSELGVGSATDLGIISAADGNGLYPSIAHLTDGSPIIAYRDNGATDQQVFVKRFDGAAWVEFSAGSASGDGVSASPNGVSTTDLVIDGNGHPLLTWVEHPTGRSDIHAARYDGAAWQFLGPSPTDGGGISNSDTSSYDPRIDVAATGEVTVIWREQIDDDYTFALYAKRYAGGSWQEVGVGSASGTGVSDSPANVQHAILDLDADGNPVVAWSDRRTGNDEIYFKRFTGGAWAELVPGSATGGGASNSGAFSGESSMAVGGQRVCAAWTEGGELRSAVVLRCTDL